MTKVTSVADYPADTKYLLIVFKTTSVYTPPDQRSITNPGHGYPGGTESYNTSEIFAYSNTADLQAHIQKLIDQNPKRSDLLILNVGEKIWIAKKIDLVNT